jgi:hypothetical protein
MHLKRIRAGFFGVLLAMTLGPITPSSAISQTPLFSPDEDGPPKAPEEPAKRIPPKISFAFRASELYFAGGTAFDMTTTVRGLDHPTTALRSDGTFLAHYYVVEKGWAGVFGRTDPYTATAANVLLNVGIDRLGRKLYTRGGKWRALAYGTVLLKGTLNVIAAGENTGINQRINQKVRIATGYKGQIVWSR